MTVDVALKDGGAVFRHPSGHDDAVSELDGLLDRRETGRLDGNGYRRALDDLVGRHPWLIDGHVHVGDALYERREFEPALEAYGRGYAMGAAALPAGFDGRVAWRHPENRAFLRAAHGVALCQARTGRRDEGISTMARMLAWNPEDHQGIRLVIGSELLRAGEDERAMSFFEPDMEPDFYPPFRYETALLLLRQGLHVEAATSLRRGFVENGYIAEALCGNPHPLPGAIWHGSDRAGPGLAMEYVLDYGMLWHVTPEAVAFLRWLHTHPKVMAERAGILQLEEALLWERDAARRASIFDEAEAARERIDDRLSEEIVAERTDRHGRTVIPWLRSGDPETGRTTE